MKVKALKTFFGTVNMQKGQIAELKDLVIINDLKKMGLIEILEEEDVNRI